MAERGHGDDRGLDGVGAERGDAGGGLDGFEAAVRGLEPEPPAAVGATVDPDAVGE